MNKRKNGVGKAAIIFAVIIIAAILVYLYLSASTNSIPIKYQGYANSFTNLSFYSVAPAHYQQYNNSSAPKCQVSKILLNSSGLGTLCTSSYISKNSNDTSLPYSITLSYYIFNSKSNESFYLDNITQFLNTTPWPSGIDEMSNISYYGNSSVIETTLTFTDPTPYNHVNTVYLEKNLSVLSISSLSLNGSNMTGDQRLDLQMLHNWYINATST